MGWGWQSGKPGTKQHTEAPGVRCCLAETICGNSRLEINPKSQEAKQAREQSFVNWSAAINRPTAVSFSHSAMLSFHWDPLRVFSS